MRFSIGNGRFYISNYIDKEKLGENLYEKTFAVLLLLGSSLAMAMPTFASTGQTPSGIPLYSL